MLRAQDRSYTRLDTLLLLGALGCSVIAMSLPVAWSARIAGTLRSTAFMPFVWLQEQAEQGRTSRARFQAVTAERDSASYAAQFLPALRAENHRLRELLGLSQRIATPFVPAEVLHQAQATDGRMLLLNVGAGQGLGPLDPVVSPEGLVGVVQSVAPTTSVAMSWAHPEFRVSAVTEDGRSFGIVAPSSSATASDASLELRGVPYRDSIPNGARILSSGLGGVYPRGIPIGTVVGVASEQKGWERVYRLRPAASPSVASHVLVLIAPRDGAVAEGFPSDSILRALAADSAARQASADSALRAQVADSVATALRDSAARALRLQDSLRAVVPGAAAPRPADTTGARPRPARPATPRPASPRPQAPAAGGRQAAPVVLPGGGVLPAAPRPAAPRPAAPRPTQPPRDTSR